MQVIIFSKGAICVPLDDQEKKHMYPVFAQSYQGALCEDAVSSMRKQYAHRAPIGALCEGALCGSTLIESCLYEKGLMHKQI